MLVDYIIINYTMLIVSVVLLFEIRDPALHDFLVPLQIL